MNNIMIRTKGNKGYFNMFKSIVSANDLNDFGVLNDNKIHTQFIKWNSW